MVVVFVNQIPQSAQGREQCKIRHPEVQSVPRILWMFQVASKDLFKITNIRMLQKYAECVTMTEAAIKLEYTANILPVDALANSSMIASFLQPCFFSLVLRSMFRVEAFDHVLRRSGGFNLIHISLTPDIRSIHLLW